MKFNSKKRIPWCFIGCLIFSILIVVLCIVSWIDGYREQYNFFSNPLTGLIFAGVYICYKEWI